MSESTELAPARDASPPSTHRTWRLVYGEIIELPDPMAQAIQILRTARGLVRAGVPVHVSARRLRPTDVRASLRALLGDDPDEGLTVEPLIASHKGLAGLQYRARLTARLIGATPDTVFYGRSRKHTRMLLAMRRRLRSRARILYEFHNIESEIAREKGEHGKQARIREDERAICAEADGIVSISAPMAEDLVRLFALEREPAIVPDAVEPEAFVRTESRPLDGDEVRIAYAGSLYPYKGVDQLLETVALLPETFTLSIIGGQGPADLMRLRRSAADDPRLAGRVRFTGLVEPSRVGAELAKADIVCLPAGHSLRSTRYTSPLKLFEAMAVGVPIVAAPVPALTSVLEHGLTGWIADGTSPAALAAAVEEAARSKDVSRRIGAAAAEEARAFTWDARARRIIEYVESL